MANESPPGTIWAASPQTTSRNDASTQVAVGAARPRPSSSPRATATMTSGALGKPQPDEAAAPTAPPPSAIQRSDRLSPTA